MTDLIVSAFKAARSQGRSSLTGLAWAYEDVRDAALESLYDAGVPPLLLAHLDTLPELFGRAEYACKTQWHEFLLQGAIGELIWHANHEAWRDWQ